MKKVVPIVILILYIIVTIKYFTSPYEITYKINGIEVKEKYENGQYSFLVDNKYIFNYSKNRKLSKKLIKNLKIINEKDYECINVDVDRNSYTPVCVHNNEYISYDLLTNKEEDKEIIENKNFKYYNEPTGYIAIWKYNGIYIFNDTDVKDINIFKKDTYNSILSIIIDKFILLPNYDEEYLFTSFIILNIETGKYKKVETDYEISYDAYIVGTNGKKVYLFDNKYENLYEINLKKGKVKLIGSEKLGYIKLVDGKKEKALQKEYTIDKITYFEKQEKDIIVDNNFYYFKDYEDIKVKFATDEITILDVYENDIYYIEGTKLYLYNVMKGNNLIVDYYELNFNSTNKIFIYNNKK